LSADSRPWVNQFQIQSEVDLDFVIGQGIGYPVGMLRASPPEFRRRILAGAISYQLQLKSVDYALKRYVGSDTYEDEDPSLGDAVSDYLRNSVAMLMKELRNLHTAHPAFGTAIKGGMMPTEFEDAFEAIAAAMVRAAKYYGDSALDNSVHSTPAPTGGIEILAPIPYVERILSLSNTRQSQWQRYQRTSRRHAVPSCRQEGCSRAARDGRRLFSVVRKPAGLRSARRGSKRSCRRRNSRAF
jgi:hypothetical protein